MNQSVDNQNGRPMLFICHTGLDEAYVTDLAAKLEAKGVRCWYYERDNFGESIGSAVDKALDDCHCLLFVMSCNLLETSRWIQNELCVYCQTKKKIIPLRVDMPDVWWPRGSRSLIGSIPVMDDADGKSNPLVVETIVSRIKGHGNPSTNKGAHVRASRFRYGIRHHLVYGVLNFIVLVVIVCVTASAINEVGNVSPEKELKNLVNRKKLEMSPSAFQEWDMTLKRIDCAKQLFSVIGRISDSQSAASMMRSDRSAFKKRVKQYEDLSKRKNELNDSLTATNALPKTVVPKPEDEANRLTMDAENWLKAELSRLDTLMRDLLWTSEEREQYFRLRMKIALNQNDNETAEAYYSFVNARFIVPRNAAAFAALQREKK